MDQGREVSFTCVCGHQNSIDILPYFGEEQSWNDPAVSCVRCGRTGTAELQVAADPTGAVAKTDGPKPARHGLPWTCTKCNWFGNIIDLQPEDGSGAATDEGFISPCLLCGSLYRVSVNVRVEFPADPLVTCPCCGYVTLHRAAAMEICPICFWEDEYFAGDPDVVTAANRLSLREAQRNFVNFGACDEGARPHVRPPRPYHRKDPRWKPAD